MHQLFWVLIFVLSCSSCFDSNKKHAKDGILDEREGFYGICNTRRFIKGNIYFEGSPISNGNNYDFLLIGTPTSPYAGVPPLFAKSPDGKVYNFAEITSNELASVQWSSRNVGGKSCREINIGRLFPDGIAPKWPEGTKRIQFDKWLIWMNDGIIISLFANTWGEGSYLPSIGKHGINCIAFHLHKMKSSMFLVCLIA